MAAITIRTARAAKGTAVPRWPTRAPGLARRAADRVAAAVLVLAVAAAVLQLAAELLSWPVPGAIIAVTVLAIMLRRGLRRRRRAPAPAGSPGCRPAAGRALSAEPSSR